MRDYVELVKRLKESDDNCNAECFECSGECLSSGCNIFSEAADAIEELLKENGELENSGRVLMAAFARLKEKVPTWISVEERLPEGNGTRYEYDLEESNLVLVYGINHIGEMAYGLGRYIYDHDDPKDSGWNGNMDCDYDLDYCTVTHWMPLPEPPEEDAK